MHITSFESPEQGTIGFSLEKSVTALLRHFISTQSNPISIVLISKDAIPTSKTVANLDSMRP